jgi:small subunit ribosomal protein SAe
MIQRPEEEDDDEFYNGQSTNPAEAAYKQSESSWNAEKPTWGDDAE